MSCRLHKYSGSSQKGVTLVEALVALAIFGAVALASITILSITLNGRAQIERHAKLIGDVQKMRAMVQDDLVQQINRPVRSVFQGAEESAFFGGLNLGALSQNRSAGTVLMRLTRLGNVNPKVQYARSSLLRVSYIEKDGGLYREISYYPDRTAQTPVQSQLVVADISDIKIEFFMDKRWIASFDSNLSRQWPEAVKISFTHRVLGPIEQKFLIFEQPTIKTKEEQP